MPIHILPPEVANQIAAGEVVERPASAVKELIENSLDAAATDIRLEIREGGRRLIRVQDDGCGIPAGEVGLAFQRHATSKIASAADLDRITTLGFRGEALASIAAVAHVTLLTRTRDETAGTLVRVVEGREIARELAGTPPGASVTVEHLFANVPARLKFLKQPATEAAHIQQVVTRYALAYPERRFSLVTDGKLVFQSSGSGKLYDVLVKVYGLEMAREMLPLADGRWQMADGESQMADGESQMADGESQMADGESQMADSESQMADGESQMADGRWQMADGESQGGIRDFDDSPQPSAISHTPPAISHTPSAISHTPSAISHTPSAISHTPSAISHTPSAISHTPPAISHTPSAISHTPSAISHTPSAISVVGYTGAPGLHRGNRGYITLFVNRRWFQDTSVAYAVIQAYHTLLPVGRFPVAVVFIELDPADVDVNVHPTKAEVRFREPGAVFSAVQKAVRRAVADHAPIPQVGFGPAPAAASEPQSFGGPGWTERREALLGAGQSHLFPSATLDAAASPASGRPTSNLQPPTSNLLPLLRVVGQLAATYIVAEGPDGLYLIDQHAAHERVLYEQMLAEHAASRLAVQPLLEPLVLDLGPEQAAVAAEELETLNDLGLAVEPFGGSTYLVRSLPAVLGRDDPLAAVTEIIDGLARRDDVVEATHEARLVTLICKRAAVKGNTPMNLAEMQELVRRLEACRSPRTCPHGRPTMIYMSATDLARQFGRT